ncbi:MAG TPA: polysaccharide deacetylase family protein [Ktedonobacterales bacterium]|nr:polysaccharide deacetylase family protein [Ktedonobacterales bacterium]
MRIYRTVLALVAACFYYSGFVPLARWLRRRGRQGQYVVMLNYHRATIGDLSAHLHYLSRHYRVIPLDHALEDLSMSPARDGASSTFVAPSSQDRDHRTPLVITFDDGYFDNYAHAARLAAELRVPITLFLVPGYMESRQRFWWYEAEAMVRDARAKEVTVENHTYSLARPADQLALRQWIDARVRTASAVSVRESFIASTRAALDAPSDTSGDDPDTLPFGWDEAYELLANPFVTFGAHTMRHPILARLSDPAEVREEVVACRAALEQGLGRQITAFAYPVGKGEDIDERAVRAVREAGYRWAVTTIPGYNTPATKPHLLRRISTDPDEPIPVLAAQVAGIWHVFALSRLRNLPDMRRRATTSGMARPGDSDATDRLTVDRVPGDEGRPL